MQLERSSLKVEFWNQAFDGQKLCSADSSICQYTHIDKMQQCLY